MNDQSLSSFDDQPLAHSDSNKSEIFTEHVEFERDIIVKREEMDAVTGWSDTPFDELEGMGNVAMDSEEARYNEKQ